MHEHDHAAPRPTPTSDPTTALAQPVHDAISNDKKKTSASDNTEHAMTLADVFKSATLQQRERKTKKTSH